jgi:hypothetical protein
MSQKRNIFNNAAFTIIELAIVIVIIAVILGGVLVAGNITDSARTSSLVSEISKFVEAKNSFKEIYEYRPGDVPFSNAQAIFGTTTNAGITNCTDDTFKSTLGNDLWDNEKEEGLIWMQLSASKLIDNIIDYDWSNTAITATDQFRPVSNVYGKDGGGWTFLRTVRPVSAIDYSFYNVLRIGGNDATFSKAVVPLRIHIDVDKKIDEANTPLRGRYFVTGSCYSGVTATSTPQEASLAKYSSENTKVNCTGNYAESDSYSSGGGL